jgi:Uncharacterized protein conserved in bacteria (DUF2188)
MHAKKKGPNIWVVRYKTRFSIKEEGRSGYLIPPLTQALATTIGRMIARANGSELIVQSAHGRIRIRDSHGADPFPPRG